MRCKACDEVIRRIKINPKTQKLEDLCDVCLSAAYNPDASTSDEQQDAADTVNTLDELKEPWN